MTKAIQQYDVKLLPTQLGESIYFENIGTIALNEAEYEIEALTATNIYKITKL